MKRALRYAGFGLALAAALAAGWRIVATRASDSLAAAHPRRALAWDANNSDARLALAQRELESHDYARAAANARRLLRHAPLQADAFAVLARVDAATGHPDAARRLFALALQRAPRNQYARAWLIGDQLQHGAYPAALRDITVLFGIAPAHEANLIPLLTRVAAADPAFATALGKFLATGPSWRGAMLGDLLANAPVATVDAVFGTLQAAQALDDADAGRWYARLEKDGLWGEAYGRWAGRVAATGNLPLVYNGNFERPVTGIGFDWQMRGEPGVSIDRVTVDGTGNAHAAAVTFLDRRANDIGFGQNLLLAPGSYRLTFRARGTDLRSDKGLQWVIRCVGNGPVLGTSERLEGSFAWKTVAFDFTVPASQCPAQWLALANPGADGAGKLVSGELWFTGFRMTPVRASP